MVNIYYSVDRASVSSCESSSALSVGAHSSFFVSPRFPDQSDCMTVALQRAFGHKGSFFSALMSIEVPDKDCLQLHLLHMHRRNFRLLTITQALTALRRFLTFLKHRGRSRMAEIRRSDLEAFVEHEQDRGQKLSTVRTHLARIYVSLSFLIEEEITAPDFLVQKIKLRN